MVHSKTRITGLSALAMTCMIVLGCREASPPAAGQTPRSDAVTEARVGDLEREWSDAYARKDFGWYDRHVATEHRTVLSDGRVVTRANGIEYMKTSPPPQQISTDEAEVRVYGDVAVALVTQSYIGSDGKPGRLRMTDVWVRTPDQDWKVVHSQEAAISVE